MSPEYLLNQYKVKRRYTIRVNLTVFISVSGWSKVYVEKELVIDLSALRELEDLDIKKATLIVNSEVSVPATLKIYVNGYTVYTGLESRMVSVDFDPKYLVIGLNQVRVEAETSPLFWISLRVNNVVLELDIETTSDKNTAEQVVNDIVDNTRDEITKTITPPAPTPTQPQPQAQVSGFLTEFTEFMQTLPQLLLILFIVFVIIEIVRLFKR